MIVVGLNKDAVYIYYHSWRNYYFAASDLLF